MDKKDAKLTEKIVIGTILNYPEWLEEVRLSETFFSGVYKQIYKAIDALKAEKKTITRTNVFFKLQDIGNIGTELNACEESGVSFRSEFLQYANELIAVKCKERLSEIGNILYSMRDGERNVDDMIDYVRKEVAIVEQSIYNVGTAVNGEECYNDFLNEYMRVVRDKDATPYISTGFAELDNIIKFRSGLFILAGRPAMGKTAVALIIAKNMAKSGKRVVIRSLEMSATELMLRYACSTLDNQQDKTELRLYKYDNENLFAVPDKIGLKNMLIDDTSASIEDIIADTRQLHRDGKCDILIIDYLSLIRTARGERRDIEVSDITTRLKLLSKELNIPVLLLAQLNRACEARADRKPVLSDLRESGGIEQDADVVMMIYRPEYYEEHSYTTLGGRTIPSENLGVICIRKNRHGRTGEGYVEFNDDMTDARDWNFNPIPVKYYNDNDKEEESNLPF